MLGGALLFSGDRFWPQAGSEQLQKRAPALFFLLCRYEQSFTGESLNALVSSGPREPLMMCFSFSSHSPWFHVHIFTRWVKLWSPGWKILFAPIMSETKQTLTVNACTGRDLLITGSMLPTVTLLLKASPARDRWGPGAGRVETVMHSAHLTALLHQRGLFSATDAHRVSTCNTISVGNGSQFKSYSWDSIKSDSKCQASSISNSLFPPSPFLPSCLLPSFCSSFSQPQHYLWSMKDVIWNLCKGAYLYFPFIISKYASMISMCL